MRIVIALGGNALLKRGEPQDIETQRRNVRAAVRSVAALLPGNEVVITHGNGPQIGLLALQMSAASGTALPGLDVLGAQTDGMIGYWLEREFGNLLQQSRAVTLLTQVEVDLEDRAFKAPTKFIGPVYEAAEGQRLASLNGWSMALDGTRWRRVVPSPAPRSVCQVAAIDRLLAGGFLVICAGGGGIPVARDASTGELTGVDAVVDKDLTSELVAEQLHADVFMMLTDAPAVYLGWGQPTQREIRSASPSALRELTFAAGSMGPKVAAACRFAESGTRRAYVGSLEAAANMIDGEAGTLVSCEMGGITFRDVEDAA
jgi:carbamate kinase